MECDDALENTGTGTGLSEFSNWKDEIDRRMVHEAPDLLVSSAPGRNGAKDSNGASNTDR